MFEKIMNDLQSLGLSRKKVCAGLVQLALNPHVCLNRQSIDHYVRKRKYEEASPRSTKIKDPNKLKESEINQNSRPKEIRTCGDQRTEELTGSKQDLEAGAAVYNADDVFVERDTAHLSDDPVTKVDEKSTCPSPPKKLSREKQVDRINVVREGMFCKKCKDACTCDDLSSSKDDDVFESDEVISKKNPACPDEKVPELIDDRVGKDIQRVSIQNDIGKIKLNLNNLPRLKERFLKEMICNEKIGAEASKNLPEETATTLFKKRRRICSDLHVSIPRKEERTRRKREKIRQLFGDVQTQSEEEHEHEILNIAKRRKKDSSDSCDSGVGQEDDVFFKETFIQSDLETRAAREDIAESFNCRKTQFAKNIENDKTATSFRKVRKAASTEDKDERSEDKEKKTVGENGDIEDKFSFKNNDGALFTDKERLLLEIKNATERHEETEEDNPAAVADKAMGSDNAEKEERVRCNDNATDKPDTILTDSIEATPSLSQLKDADLGLSDKRDNLESSVSHESEDTCDNTLLNGSNVLKHIKEEPTSSLARQESINANESSVVQRENTEKRCDLPVSISSERLSENVEDKRNVANISDSESRNCNGINVEDAARTVTATKDKSVDDNVDNNSSRDVKPLIVNMQELSKESLMSAVRNYFTEHLEDIIKNALVKDAQQVLPEKMAKEFVESLGVPENGCKEKECDIDGNLEVDANRNICENGTDGITGRITQRKDKELSSHTVSEGESVPGNARTDTEKENIHLEGATRMESQNTGSSESEETTTELAEPINCSTEVEKSPNGHEDSRKKDVEPAAPPPVAGNLGNVSINPADPAVARLRVRTGAELGARWCPTPVNPIAAPAQLPTTITTTGNIAPTSASVPPLSTTSLTVSAIPPPASAPPFTGPTTQEACSAETWEQMKPILLKVINTILIIRHNLEEQYRITCIVPHQPVHLEYLLKLRNECIAHAASLKRETVSVIRLFSTNNVQKVLMFIAEKFNYSTKSSRNLTVRELTLYLNPGKGNQKASLGNNAQMTTQHNNTNNAQPTRNVVGGSPSYVHVNLPFDSYMNAPIVANNASYVPNASQRTWQSNNPQNPQSTYIAPSTAMQQQTLNGAVNQVRAPGQNSMGFPNYNQSSHIPQTQRMTGVASQNTGQSSKYHINNILGAKTSQSVSSTANVPHVAPQRTFQQTQPTFNVPQRQTSAFSNTQSNHPQQRVNPNPPNARFGKPFNLTQKNVGQHIPPQNVPPPAYNSSHILHTTTLASNMQYLQTMYEQVPTYVTQGIPQINAQPHIIQQTPNPYHNTQQQQSSLLLQNGQLLTTLPATTNTLYSQNLNPSSIIPTVITQEPVVNQTIIQAVTLPVAPAQTIQTEYYAANLPATVTQPVLSSAASNANVSQNTTQVLQSNRKLREIRPNGTGKAANPAKAKDVARNSKVSQPKESTDETVKATSNASFTEWSSFTEIQKMILIDQLIFYFKSGLSYVNVPKEKHQLLRTERSVLKLFSKALTQEAAKLQKAAEACSNNSSVKDVTALVVISDNQTTERSSEPSCSSVQEEGHKAADNTESQTNQAQHNSESSSKEQRTNNTTEGLQEVPTNAPIETSDNRKSEATLREQPLQSLPRVVEDEYKMSNNDTLLASEKEEAEAPSEQAKPSNVNETEGVGESSSNETTAEEVKEKSESSGADDERVEEIADTNTSTEKERPATPEMSHVENPDAPDGSNLSELQESIQDTSRSENTNTEATVSEDLQENSENVEFPESKTIKTEKSVPNDEVAEDVNELEQMEMGIPEQEISADLSIFEELANSETGLIIIEEDSSDKILSEVDLDAEYALVSYEEENEDMKFVMPNIADVRSIEPEVFEQMSSEKDEDVIFVDTDETVNLVAPNDDTFLSDTNEDMFEEDILCLRCKRTQSMVLCKLCLEAHYCSKRCQELHWKAEHHKNCRQSTDMLDGTERPSTSNDSFSPIESV